jgi:hypothetical protein
MSTKRYAACGASVDHSDAWSRLIAGTITHRAIVLPVCAPTAVRFGLCRSTAEKCPYGADKPTPSHPPSCSHASRRAIRGGSRAVFADRG